MSKGGKIKNIYYQKGVKSLINEIAKYVLISSTLAPYLKKLFGKLLHHKIYIYLQLSYWPQIREPRSFNEKIMYRKLFTDNDLFPVVEDKYRVRDYVSDKVGDEVLPELYHVTQDPSTIPFDSLPDEYVIKPTHMSGPIIFVDENQQPDRTSIKNSCQEWIFQTYGDLREEYWYEQITPRILIEERLRDQNHGTPPDFKFFVFHGQVEYIQVDTDRFTDHKRRIYDENWNPQDFELKFPLGPTMEEPAKLEEMIEISERLGEDFEYIRVDLYEIDSERVVFGELTVAHGSGEEQFRPQKYDFKLGKLW